MRHRRASRRRRTSAARFGVLGAAGILAVASLVAVSYRAQDGLPFQSRYTLSTEVPSAARLGSSTEVRIGGVRVGRVQAVTAVPGAGTAPPAARLELSLSPSVAPLPADTRVRIRAASILGAPFVELVRGHSPRTLRSGGRLERAQGEVQVTDLLQGFDRATSRRMREVLRDLGDGITGRGRDLNATIASTASLARPLTNVLTTFGDRRTALARFVRGYAATARGLGRDAPAIGGLVRDGATTLDAIAAAGPDLGRALDALPPAEAATTAGLASTSPPLRRAASIARDLHASAVLLRRALPAVDGALEASIPPLRDVPALGRVARPALLELDRVTRDPATPGAMRKLAEADGSASTLLAALVPAQLQCNIFGILGRNAASTLAGAGVAGTPLVQVAPALLGLAGEAFQNGKPSDGMHRNANPHEGSNECEAGNEPFDSTVQLLGNPPTSESNTTEETRPPAGVPAGATG